MYLWIDGQILSRYNSPTSTLSKGLHVNSLKAVLDRVVLEDDNPAAVAANDDVVPGAAGQAEGHQRPNTSENLGSQQSVNFSSVGIRPHQLEGLTAGYYNLLQFELKRFSIMLEKAE